MTPPWVRVAGIPVGVVGDLTLTNRWPLGNWEASWSMLLDPYEQPPHITRDASVEVLLGERPIWSGELLEPDWAEGTFSAAGSCRSAEGALCLSATGTTTSTPNVAVDQAAARGLITFSRGGNNLSSTPFAVEETANLNTVSSLLDAWSDEAGVRWFVRADRIVRTGVDPTVPAWHILPGAGELGVSTEKLAGRVVGRWANSSGAYQTTAVGTGRPEVAVDLTGLGGITSTRATSVLNGILAKAGPAIGSWANGITITAEQITNPGGVHPHLGAVWRSVSFGTMVRLLGHRDPRNGLPFTDVVVGEAVWNLTEQTLTLNPVGLAARDLAHIIEESGGAAA